MFAWIIVSGLVGHLGAVPSPLGLFTVVQFPNDACTASSGLTGTCVTAAQCSERGGTASGNCAASFGVCCLVAAATCDSSGAAVTYNNTYMRNPSYPSAYPTSTSTTTCAYKVTKLSDNICQVRLDFQTLELGQTASSGACTDSIQATLSAESSVTTSYPAVCGTSTGHHMYLDVGATSGNTATITVNLAASSASAKWNVLASQIECNTNYLAPSGCTMYLTGVTGSWSMYGYKTGVTTTEHLQSQDYNVCIRRESGYCSIRHTAQSSTSFDLTSAANADTAISARGAAACYADFIGIPGGSLDGNPATHDRYCGGVLGWSDPGVPVSQAIISKVVPFRVHVHTDATDAPSATPYGVALNYQQLAC